MVFRLLFAALKLLLTYFCRIQNDLKPKSMQYHEIGKTGMKVSSLSFGASSLGGVFHDLKEKEGIQAVFAAVEAGMNFIDVSPYYGHYKAETVLG